MSLVTAYLHVKLLEIERNAGLDKERWVRGGVVCLLFVVIPENSVPEVST